MHFPVALCLQKEINQTMNSKACLERFKEMVHGKKDIGTIVTCIIYASTKGEALDSIF